VVGGAVLGEDVFVQLHRGLRAMPMRETAARDSERSSLCAAEQKAPLLIVLAIDNVGR
jgi:hypothetical protein